MNTAEKIAHALGNDGTTFETANGTTLEQLCETEGASPEWRDGYRTGDTIRFEFADGSAIVVAGEAWDLEGDKPFSWAM